MKTTVALLSPIAAMIIAASAAPANAQLLSANIGGIGASLGGSTDYYYSSPGYNYYSYPAYSYSSPTYYSYSYTPGYYGYSYPTTYYYDSTPAGLNINL